jgi:hypothetical protein
MVWCVPNPLIAAMAWNWTSTADASVDGNAYLIKVFKQPSRTIPSRFSEFAHKLPIAKIEYCRHFTSL